MAKPFRLDQALMSLLGGAAPAFVNAKIQRHNQNREDKIRQDAQDKEQRRFDEKKSGTQALLQMLNTANQVDPERMTASGMQNLLDETAIQAARAGMDVSQAQNLISQTAAFESDTVKVKRALEAQKAQMDQVEFFQRNTKELNDLDKDFDTSVLNNEERNTFLQSGTASAEMIRKLKRRETAIDPFTRALLSKQGSEAGKAASSVANVQAITGDVISVLTNFRKIPEKFRGPFDGRTIGQGAKFLKSDANLTTFEDAKQIILGNIAKQLGGEAGVLTDRDIQRISDALPNLQDTEESADQKTKFLLNFIDRRVKGKQKQAGVPVTGIEIPPEFIDKDFNLEKIDRIESTPDTPVQVQPAQPGGAIPPPTAPAQPQVNPATGTAPSGNVDYLKSIGVISG